jgi:hypothetical protein
VGSFGIGHGRVVLIAAVRRGSAVLLRRFSERQDFVETKFHRQEKETHMKTIPANLLASVLFALLLSPSLFATDYRYMRITMPDGSPTFVKGIDARGDIIGTYTDAGGVGHNFLLHNGAFTNIDYPGNGDIVAHDTQELTFPNDGRRGDSRQGESGYFSVSQLRLFVAWLPAGLTACSKKGTRKN